MTLSRVRLGRTFGTYPARVLVDPQVLPFADLSAGLGTDTGGITYITNRARKIYTELSRAMRARVFTYEDVFGRGTTSVCLDAGVAEVWSKVIDDHQTFMLYDRSFTGPVHFESSSLKVARLIRLCVAAQRFLEAGRFEAFILESSPHNIHTWVFARVAEMLGISVVYLQHTALPWRVMANEGLSRFPRIVFVPSVRDRDGDENEARTIDSYIESKSAASESAVPSWVREGVAANGGRLYNGIRDLRIWWRRPELVANKFLCYRRYAARASGVPSGPFAGFFLHYQPERTSLPEGYGFAQQLAAVLALRQAMPADMLLLVKEHPATFTNVCSPKERVPAFYDRLCSIKGVHLVPLDVDTYDLMDNAAFVATITGTVALEALIRGRPAVVFGAGPIQGLHANGFHRYTARDDLASFISECGTLQDREISLAARNYLRRLAGFTYSGLARGECWQDTISEYRRVQRRAKIDALCTLMSALRQGAVLATVAQ